MKKILTILLLFVGCTCQESQPVRTSALEDYNTYTEVDASGDITIVASDSIHVESMSRGASSRVYYAFPAGHFNGDFVHEGAYRQSSSSDLLAYGIPWAVSNYKNSSWTSTEGASGSYYGIYFYNAATKVCGIRECNAGSVTSQDSDYNYVTNTNYWFRVIYDADASTYGTLYFQLFSDQARTTQLNSTTSLALTRAINDSAIFAVQNLGSSTPNLTAEFFELNLGTLSAQAALKNRRTGLLRVTHQ